MKTGPHKESYTNVHSSFASRSPKLETTPMPLPTFDTEERINETWPRRPMARCSAKRKETTEIHHMNGSQNHYAKSDPSLKEYTV